MLEHLSQTCLLADPNNHCARIWDRFEDEVPEWTFVVIPFLSTADSRHDFFVVNDIMEFIDDALEGLTFLHAQGIAHRRVSPSTIRTDESPLYPGGFHPIVRWRLPDFTPRHAPSYSRSTARTRVRNYYTGFGDAVPGGPPEAFRADVAALGRLLDTYFTERYSRTEFLAPLVADMKSGRPTAAEALAQWRATRARTSWVGRMRRLPVRSDDESWVWVVLLDVFFMVLMLLERLPAPVRLRMSAISCLPENASWYGWG
ncbi:hypothetical protein PsYK624_087000 [Phanerochaete sordida]|uniref:Protein kinase domain-containing protein n=1 Tax=Phanerochaete sordida TaxID=48140 RepID=A0A9P3LER8_9APHY|nr:hypothetical protein PsYK624_087000 [Phanerochaete sordida]